MENVNETLNAIETPSTAPTAPSPADIDVIAAAIEAAKARKSGEKRPRPAISAEEKAAASAAREAQREAKRAARSAAREARAAAKAQRSPAHLKKVEKAQALLPDLSPDAAAAFASVTATLGPVDLASLAAHLQHNVRVQRTLRSAGEQRELQAGDRVRVTGGDPRFVGAEGTVVKAQRIRCYVEVAGKSKPLYLFTADVEALAAPSPAAE